LRRSCVPTSILMHRDWHEKIMKDKGSACSKVLPSFPARAAAQTAWMTIAPLAVESEPSLARSLKLVFPVGLLLSDKRRMRLVHACNRYYPACLIVEGILALRPKAVYLDAKRILNSRLNYPLVDARSPPGARAYTDEAGEHSRHVTLIGETAYQSHLR
jgi:hypothetical protein